MVMHELQTEVQSECMTSTLERSKSKNGSLIPFVSALVLKSACPEYCAHHRISPDVLTRTENGCNVADMKHLFQWAMRLEAQLLLFKGLWNMEFPRHSHLCVCAWLSTPSCEGIYAASQGAHYPRSQQPFKYLCHLVSVSHSI